MKSAKRSRAVCRANIFDLQPLEVRRFLTTASVSGGLLRIDGTFAGETITVNRNTSGNVTVTGVAGSFANASFDRIFVNAGGGNDTIFISGNVIYDLSEISAGSGQDDITGGRGADWIHGDGGFDTANYSARTANLRVSLNDGTQDGEGGGAEGDDIDCEEVLGGAGNDTLIGTGGGSTAQDYLAGGGGNDSISGNGGSDELVANTGSDKLFGGEGDDALYAKNSDVDTVNGGTGPIPDLDLAALDGVDIVSSAAASTLAAARRIAADTIGAAALTFDSDALDPSYGGNGSGKNTGGFENGADASWDSITAAAVDAEGRVVLVGYDTRFNDDVASTDFVATRYLPNGTWDAGFGEVVVDFGTANGVGDADRALGVTTDGEGRIIIVGSSRASTEGSNDDDFAVARVSEGIEGPVVEFTRRFDITVDRGPSVPGGGANDWATDVAVQGDGKIVIVGTRDVGGNNPDYAVVRLNLLNNLDPAFNGGGQQALDVGFDEGSAVAIQRSTEPEVESIIVGGTTNGDFVVARFTTGGQRDGTFGDFSGYSRFGAGDLDEVPSASVDLLNDLVVNGDNGEIVAVGQTFAPIGDGLHEVPEDPAARGLTLTFAEDGTPANGRTYGIAGNNVTFNAVAFDAETADFAVAGSTGENFVVGRFGAGALDFAEGWTALVETDFSPNENAFFRDVALGVGFGSSGTVVVGGYSDASFEGPPAPQTAVARYGGFVDDGGPVDEYEELEGLITYDEIQSGFRSGRRSAKATFYLKSTQLDDAGNAHVDLTNGPDVVDVARVVNDEGVEMVGVNVNGIVLYFGTDTNTITIDGMGGADVIHAADDVLVTLIINGNGGADELRGGGGDDVVNGGDGADSVSGGAGHDAVLGGAGRDTVSGDAGDDILIGGLGTDELFGGDGEDILMGGDTHYDDTWDLPNVDALRGLSAEWTSGNPMRFTNIRTGGGLTGGAMLVAGDNVHDDFVRDSLTGGNDRDWFFRRNGGAVNRRDLVLDNLIDEELDDF